MKKACLIASIAIVSLSANLSAQGALSKMKEKLNSAAMPKGAYYYYYENIGKKEKAKEVLISEAFSVVDENNLATKGASKYGGDPDRNYKKIDMPGMKLPVFTDGDCHNSIIKIQDDVFLRLHFQGQACEMQFINLIEVFSTNKDFIKEIQKDDKCENYKKLETAVADYLKAVKDGVDAKNAEEKKKQDAATANVKLPVPTKTTPCNQAKLQELCQTRVGNDKILYCYFGIPDMLKPVSPTNEWKMIKEKKTVAGTYDDFITKRRIFAICVYQTEENIKNGVYNHTCITLDEEHAFDVWDGSKFNGVIKATGTMYLGRIAKENAMQYKDALK
ncbi:MAG: hypothetical protein O9353_05460 [Bacteroidia bacterium]|nr:hypothetical protein [Bacteroidia bacterium]